MNEILHDEIISAVIFKITFKIKLRYDFNNNRKQQLIFRHEIPF